MLLPKKFFKQKTLKVARQLLGCFLIRQIGKKKIIAKIIETEAYCGPKDLANHASKGRTKRTEVMFGPAGHVYVYLIYGMYYCFNVVTEKEGYPAAVLIRGVEINNQEILGPGKVCRELKIDKSLHGVDLIKSNKIWLESYKGIKNRKIKKMPRVGVDYAGEYKDKLWRFVLIK
ncbi:DNA-3-methyladenine glycosylase [Patescibacteria group bacterium]|nr:DNA-3-methyladenine glycosylase [Patescibacteria group bacterium]